MNKLSVLFQYCHSHVSVLLYVLADFHSSKKIMYFVGIYLVSFLDDEKLFFSIRRYELLDCYRC